MSQTPFDVLTDVAQGFVASSALGAVAEAGVADALGDTPKTAQELAAATGTHAGALARILRVLSGDGIFEARDGGYVHTPASRLLRKDHPQSMRGYVLAVMPVFWEPFAKISHSLATGEPGLERIHPEGFFAYLAAHPDKARLFDDAMTGKARGQVAGVVASYDFSRFGTIADIGGGRGHLLQAVLSAAPKAKGVLFDLSHVTEAAKGIASERIKLQAGDFFKDAMPVADAYLIMQVIHDWDDADATKILSGIRRACERKAAADRAADFRKAGARMGQRGGPVHAGFSAQPRADASRVSAIAGGRGIPAGPRDRHRTGHGDPGSLAGVTRRGARRASPRMPSC